MVEREIDVFEVTGSKPVPPTDNEERKASFAYFMVFLYVPVLVGAFKGNNLK